jgi:hypothetical protein
MSSNRRIEVAIGLLRQALKVLSEDMHEEYPPQYPYIVLTDTLRVLEEIKDTSLRTFALLQQTSTYAAKTLKSACPGCDRDLMLRVDRNNLVLECYNPDGNMHQSRGLANTTRWTLTPTHVL